MILALFSNMTGTTFYFPTGAAVSRQDLILTYPIINVLPCVITTDPTHTLFAGFDLLSNMKTRYNIETSLSDEDALAAIIIAIENEEHPPIQDPDLPFLVDALRHRIDTQNGATIKILDILLTGAIADNKVDILFSSIRLHKDSRGLTAAQQKYRSYFINTSIYADYKIDVDDRLSNTTDSSGETYENCIVVE
jgi:hypothetical protein